MSVWDIPNAEQAKMLREPPWFIVEFYARPHVLPAVRAWCAEHIAVDRYVLMSGKCYFRDEQDSSMFILRWQVADDS